MGNLSQEDELQRLPLRALVAFISRCARRVQDLYVLEDDHPTKQMCTMAIDAAIRVAEEFAMGGAVDANRADIAESDVMEAVAAARESDGADPGAVYAADAAYAAVSATQKAFEAIQTPASGEAIWSAIEVAGASAIAGATDETSTAKALAIDLENLTSLNLGVFPDLGETIDPMEDGPLGSLSSPKKIASQKPPEKTPSKETTKSTANSAPVTDPDDISALDRTRQALQRIDALQIELDDEDPAASSKSRAKAVTGASVNSSPGGEAGVDELQQRLQLELERVLAAKTALDQERKQLQTEWKEYQERLRKPAVATGAKQDYSAEKQKLEHAQAELAKARESFAEEVEEYDARRNKLRRVSHRLKRERRELDQEREELSEEQEKLRKHRVRLKAKLQQVQNLGTQEGSTEDVDRLTAKLQKLRDEYEELELDQETLKAEVQTLQEQLESTRANEFGDAGYADQSLLDENQQLKQQINELQKKLSEVPEIPEDLEAAREELKKAHADLNDRARRFSENETALTSAIEQLSKQRKELERERNEFATIKNELFSQKQEFCDERERFQDLIDITFRR